MYYHLINLQNMFGLELATAFAGIPQTVTTLNLSGNELNEKTGAELATAFTGLPQTVTILDLSGNYLNEKTGAELAIAFSGIPQTVTTLNLSRNYVYRKTGTELATAFAGIPQGVTTLNLSRNELYRKTGAELATAFTGLPQTITILDLSGNYLNKKTGAELAIAFAGLPQTITTLNLSGNYLYTKTEVELATAFAGIPQGVTTLNLSGNYFNEKTGAELAIAFAGLPQTVTTLNFGDDFSSITAAKANIILSLPKSITSIVINGTHYDPEEYLLTQLFTLSARESYHIEECAIEPSFDIDERMLVKIITYLQKHPSSINYLVCGLLLHRKIDNSYNEERVDLPQYLENRMMAAIFFYRKAACDAKLKPKIESILWHLRTTENENGNIQRTLKPYKLSPLAFTSTFSPDSGHLLDCADSSPVQLDIDWVNPEFILKMGLSISLGAAAIVLLCLKAPLMIAAIGTTIASTLTYAACRFFVNVERRNADWSYILEESNTGFFKARL